MRPMPASTLIRGRQRAGLVCGAIVAVTLSSPGLVPGAITADGSMSVDTKPA
jgi:hypothetical protein